MMMENVSRETFSIF